MKRMVRPVWIGALFVVGFAGIAYANPAFVGNWGLDFWSVSELQAQLDADLRLHRELDAKNVKVLQRIDIKETIITNLLADRISLREAATHFKMLNAGREDYMTVIRAVYPGASDDERICHNVIGFAEAHVSTTKRGRQQIVDRLKAELQGLVDRGEPLTVPDQTLPEPRHPTRIEP